MQTPPLHQCRVLRTPWDGIHGTETESSRHFGRHWHATHGFGLLEQGAQSSASGRGPVQAYRGDVITTNPGEVHDGRPLGGPTRRWRMLYLDPGVLASVPRHPQATPARDVELVQPVFRDARLSRALRQLFGRLETAGPAPAGTGWLACEEALVDACALLLAHHAAEAPARDMGGDVARVRERLADDLLNPPTLTELALLTGLSKYQVLRRFEKAYGVPPHAWLLQQRVERARRLIRQGLSLAEAAASCGFADQSHMTRSFARQFGYTPGAWKAAIAFKTSPRCRARLGA